MFSFATQDFEFTNDAEHFEEAQEDDDFRSATDDLEQRHAEGDQAYAGHMRQMLALLEATHVPSYLQTINIRVYVKSRVLLWRSYLANWS